MIRLFLNARLRVLTRYVHTGCLDALFLYSFFWRHACPRDPCVVCVAYSLCVYRFNLETSFDISDGVLDVTVEADF